MHGGSAWIARSFEEVEGNTSDQLTASVSAAFSSIRAPYSLSFSADHRHQQSKPVEYCPRYSKKTPIGLFVYPGSVVSRLAFNLLVVANAFIYFRPSLNRVCASRCNSTTESSTAPVAWTCSPLYWKPLFDLSFLNRFNCTTVFLSFSSGSPFLYYLFLVIAFFPQFSSASILLPTFINIHQHFWYALWLRDSHIHLQQKRQDAKK